MLASNHWLDMPANESADNHRQLRKGLKGKPVFKTHSDCEVIMHLVSLPEAPTIG
jgi:hypothetical protein